MNYLRKTIIAAFIATLFLATSCNLHDNKVTPEEKEIADQNDDNR